MASFGLATSTSEGYAPLVAGATHEEENAYWDTDGKDPKQHHHALPPTANQNKSDQGFMSKLSVTEIGTAYDNLTRSLGGQAKHLGGQAKTFGEQAKDYTLANTSTAAAAMNRFKKQVASAVDGVPMRPDDDHFRERGTTSADKEKTGSADDSEEGLLYGDEDTDGKDRDGEQDGEHLGPAGEAATAPSSVPAAAGADAKRVQVNGGMVDESAPILSFGALAATFKKKPAGGATVVQAQASDGGGHTASSDLSASGGGKGRGSRSGGDVDAECIKRGTESLVGGRQWSVLASVYDTTASVIDETVGDLFT